MTLTAGMTYYFYENGEILQDGILDDLAISTETGYISYDNVGFYEANGPDNHTVLSYQVTGDPLGASVAPEPSSFVLLGTGLLGTGLLGVAGVARRRFLA